VCPLGDDRGLETTEGLLLAVIVGDDGNMIQAGRGSLVGACKERHYSVVVVDGARQTVSLEVKRRRSWLSGSV
jgi:hypothetical protein